MTETVALESIESVSAPPRARIGLIPALTVFLSAFLLFQVQPLIGKYILPWFGGATGVWTTCLLFFQVMLLAGYAYAHLVVSRLSPRRQAILHAILLLAALATLPIIPSERLKPPDPLHPTWRIIALLALTVGLPYFALATTAPLLQAWVTRIDPRVAPYRLYALSNFASLLALVSYPFAIEPVLTRPQQAWVWSGLYLLFAIGCAYCALRGARGQQATTEPSLLSPQTSATPVDDAPPSRARSILWFALPACATALLMGTTNTLTQDVAPVPFLWVLPLALYLLTFVLAFDHPRWYSRRILGPLMIISAAALAWAMNQSLHAISIWQMLVIYNGALFVACLMCHGELARLRPHPSRLTAFYLAISAGGALGGVFVSIVAPLLFTRYLEFGIALWGCCALVLYIVARDERSWLANLRPPVAWVGLAVGMIALVAAVWRVDVRWPGAVLIERTRNFYGVLRTSEWSSDASRLRYRALHHGRVMHGLQVLNPPAARRLPYAYYGPPSGLGQTVAQLAEREDLHIGVVGLGVGTIAAFGRAGDRIRFYEIDPDVLRVADEHFSYLADSPAKVDVVLGDGRLALEREPAQQFDLLVLDAFSGDAVPVHLLTREAFEIYRRHVKPDGRLAVNITNRHLRLDPVVAAAAQQLGMRLTFVANNPKPDETAQTLSRWAILNPASGEGAALAAGALPEEPLVWTDDSASLLSVIRREGRNK